MAYIRDPVTPAEISSDLRRLIDGLVPAGAPLYVDVSPVPGAEVDDCFPLVDERVRDAGGTSVLGWSLWELPGIFVEAEFHAVWRRPDGSHIDVAAKKASTARVLFLPDPVRTYDGKQLNNRRKAISGDPAVQAYLDTFTAEYELGNRGERAGQYGLISLEGEEAEELFRIRSEREAHLLRVIELLPLIGPYSPCPCGSGKKIKWCHRAWQ